MRDPFTIYVPARAVVSDLLDAARRPEVLAKLRAGRVCRVILESYRGGCVVDEAVLRDVRDWLAAEGFETMGGLMPVYGERAGAPPFGKRGQGVELRGPFFCYSAEETVAASRARSASWRGSLTKS